MAAPDKRPYVYICYAWEISELPHAMRSQDLITREFCRLFSEKVQNRFDVFFDNAGQDNRHGSLSATIANRIAESEIYILLVSRDLIEKCKTDPNSVVRKEIWQIDKMCEGGKRKPVVAHVAVDKYGMSDWQRESEGFAKSLSGLFRPMPVDGPQTTLLELLAADDDGLVMPREGAAVTPSQLIDGIVRFIDRSLKERESVEGAVASDMGGNARQAAIGPRPATPAEAGSVKFSEPLLVAQAPLAPLAPMFITIRTAACRNAIRSGDGDAATIVQVGASYGYRKRRLPGTNASDRVIQWSSSIVQSLQRSKPSADAAIVTCDADGRVAVAAVKGTWGLCWLNRYANERQTFDFVPYVSRAMSGLRPIAVRMVGQDAVAVIATCDEQKKTYGFVATVRLNGEQTFVQMRPADEPKVLSNQPCQMGYFMQLPLVSGVFDDDVVLIGNGEVIYSSGRTPGLPSNDCRLILLDSARIEGGFVVAAVEQAIENDADHSLIVICRSKDESLSRVEHERLVSSRGAPVALRLVRNGNRRTAVLLYFKDKREPDHFVISSLEEHA